MMHHDFQLDSDALHQQIDAARSQVDHIDAAGLLSAVTLTSPLAAADMARLWFSSIDTAAIFDHAAALRAPEAHNLETFSPLYMTNTCDAECKMCGMRTDNRALQRETADVDGVIAQLRILSQRGMLAVALLTGEYRRERRDWAMRYVNAAVRATQELKFGHVLINVGSIDDDEFDVLLDGVDRDDDGAIMPKLTMSTFQETYEPEVYRKFMGQTPGNPRADFARRLVNFDRAFRAGMRVAHPGILLGLNPALIYELTALVLHSRHLQKLGMEVYLSVPRLRRISGGASHRDVDDESFVRLVSLLALALPTAKTVITTRENREMQQRLAPVVRVISAGSAAVTPYTPAGANFPLETSQFEVIDQRPFEAILSDHEAKGATFDNYNPPRVAA